MTATNVWNGVERRKNQQISYCPAHIDLVTDLACIKTAVINVEKAITEGLTFRTGVIISFIGITITIVIQIVSFAFLFGQIQKQVEVDTGRITKIELQHTFDNNVGK